MMDDLDIELEQLAEDRMILLSLTKPGTICFYCGHGWTETNPLHYFGGEAYWHRGCHRDAGVAYRIRIYGRIKRKREKITRQGKGYLLRVKPVSVEVPISKQHRWIKEL